MASSERIRHHARKECMRKTIFLIRHAEATININPLNTEAPDVLTGSGSDEARSTAKRCAELHIESLYTSKTPRAQLTANIIGITVAREPVVIDFFKERKVHYTDAKTYTYLESFEELKSRLIMAKQFLEKET